MEANPWGRQELEELAQKNPTALVELLLSQAEALREQRELIEQQRQAIASLERRVAQLEEALRERGGGGPGAAPFRIEAHKRKAASKPPGRGSGHAGEFRAAPEQIDQLIEVPVEQCPHCGEAIGETTALEQTIIELPPMRPMVVRLITHRGRCPRCARLVESTHPLQVSRACGAAGTQLGARALASAGLLRHGVGLTLRNCCAVLEKLFGLPLSPGGLSQALDRLAGRLAPSYEELRGQVQQSPVVHTDETSWWLHHERAMLWVFATPKSTLYRVVEHRNRATFHETISPNYGGVLVSDCLSVYDDATVLQHKCYAHHLKAIAAAQAGRGTPSLWLERVKALLKSAIALGERRSASPLPPSQWERRLRALRVAARAVLEETPRACPQEESVRVRLWKQRDHLFTFLEHAGVDPTNNLAERQLRPAVIRRKLSCGNKSPRGARTFEVLTSLAATCRQRGQDFLQLATEAARLQPT